MITANMINYEYLPHLDYGDVSSCLWIHPEYYEARGIDTLHFYAHITNNLCFLCAGATDGELWIWPDEAEGAEATFEDEVIFVSTKRPLWC